MIDVLDLTHEEIQNIPEEIFKYKELRQLFLGSNRISKFPLGLFESLTSITSLNLSYNKIEFIPKEISLLKNLTSFIADHNNISIIEANGISNCTELCKLDLRFNQIKELSLSNPKLEKIYLEGNPIQYKSILLQKSFVSIIMFNEICKNNKDPNEKENPSIWIQALREGSPIKELIFKKDNVETLKSPQLERLAVTNRKRKGSKIEMLNDLRVQLGTEEVKRKSAFEPITDTLLSQTVDEIKERDRIIHERQLKIDQGISMFILMEQERNQREIDRQLTEIESLIYQSTKILKEIEEVYPKNLQFLMKEIQQKKYILETKEYPNIVRIEMIKTDMNDLFQSNLEVMKLLNLPILQPMKVKLIPLQKTKKVQDKLKILETPKSRSEGSFSQREPLNSPRLNLNTKN